MSTSYIIGQNVISFLDSIVASLRNSEAITGWTAEGGGVYRADTPNTFDLAKYSYVTLEESQFYLTGTTQYEPVQVIEVTEDDNFKIKADSLPTVSSFTQSSPFFWYGTPQQINKTIKQFKAQERRYPGIFLIKRFPEDTNIRPTEQVGTIAAVSLLFMAPSDFENWTYDETHENAIKPMRQLAEAFVNKVKRSPNVVRSLFGNYTITDAPDFGVEIEDKGHVRSILDDHISGVILDIDIPLSKRYCKEATGDDTLTVQACAGVSVYNYDGTLDQVIASGTSYTKVQDLSSLLSFPADGEDSVSFTAPANWEGTYDAANLTNVDSWSLVINGGVAITSVSPASTFDIEAGDTIALTIVRTTPGSDSAVEFEGNHNA